MANEKLIKMMAESMYEGICARAMGMVEEAFPNMDESRRLWAAAAIAAGVTAAITTIREAGLLRDE